MLTLTELSNAVEQGEAETVLTVFPDMYGRLLGKRVAARFFLEAVAEGGMHACDYLLACDMEMDPVPGYGFASWEKGYGDVHCVPDLDTLRWAAWLPRTALVLCDVVTDADHEPVAVSPRAMLRRQLARARDAGFAVLAASEIELYAFDETYESARAKHYHDLTPAGRYIEDYHIFQGTKEEGLVGAIRRGLEASGVPVESTKGEWGPGQQEINLAYGEALTQADRSAVYKHAAKEIAFAQGKAVTFMAKWDERFAGSSMHVHISLWDAPGGRNLFEGAEPVGPVLASDTFRWFLGGWMAHARELTACYAPNVSSYKRYQAGSFAPTAVAWSYDNRTAGFRVVGRGQSLRVECRIPGADANPYVVLAAAIAAGLDGIEKKIEPPPVFAGDIYQAKDLPRVPGTLREATALFAASELAREAFGADVVEHYTHFLETEQRKFDEVVTCWERARFFERV
jgi:glutamine synthetase